MAEDSVFWSGTATGDAASATLWQAPYSDVEYSDIWSKKFAADSARGFVVPDTSDDRLVTEASSPVAMTVEVGTGSIFIRGRIYENTATNVLSIASNSTGNPRLDRIVVRVTFASQIIRLAVLQGTAAATPALPALTQNSTTYEIPIAYVWVANGAVSISDTDIHDTREFLCTSANFNDSYDVPNLVHNSEFMGFSELSGGATTNPPDGWDLTLTPSDIANYTKPSQMSRGRAVQITTDAASEGIQQSFKVVASTMYAIKLLTRVTAGDVGSIVVTTDSAAPNTITRYTRRTGAWIEEYIYYSSEADATTMTIRLLGLNNGDVIQYGQVLAIKGYVAGPFRQFRETIFFTEGITDANWSATGKATGTTTIDLDADFQALVLPETKSVYLAIQGKGSASAAQSTAIYAEPFGYSSAYSGIILTGVPNNTDRYTQALVPLDSSMRFDLEVTALAASTLTATVLIIGIII